MLKSYSQNQEDQFILSYFGKFKGNLLEVGANDGQTLSNSKLLIDNGWSATLVEPGATFSQLEKLHKDNPKVTLHNYAIGGMASKLTFYESGAHVKGGNDQGLVSTLDFDETIRWRKSGVQFTERVVDVKPYEFKDKFDFISIDAEGLDYQILRQIDLSNTRALCIEWNSDTDLYRLYVDYCKGFKIGLKNAENLVFIR